MAAEMQPRTQLYALAEVFANLALQTLGTPAIHHKYEFPGIGQETKLVNVSCCRSIVGCMRSRPGPAP